MTAPKRRRPPKESPISLTPHVEAIKIPTDAEPKPGPALEPAPTPESSSESTYEGTPVATLTTAPTITDSAPAAIEPAGADEAPVEPAAATATENEDEEWEGEEPGARTGTSGQQPTAAPASSTAAAQAVPAAALAPQPVAEPAVYIPPNMKQPVTINMRTALKLRAETAVLQTGHLPGGYRSQVKLIEAALEKELERLEAEYNNDQPFPPNTGDFRTGRPLGS